MSITRNNGEVTLTFGGVEIKGTLDKELKMSKYIPKVGDIVLSGADLEYEVLHVGKEYLFVRNEVVGELAAKFDYFQPIPTKVDIEREKLDEILSECYVYGTESKVNAIQQAGFTIPKKVKRSEIADVVANTSPMISVEDLVDEICNLLGDLIED